MFSFRTIAITAYLVATGAILLLIDLAYSYSFTTGYGMHPVLAFGAIALLVAYMVIVFKTARHLADADAYDDYHLNLKP